MPRFANMLVEGMRSKGHSVQIWSPNPKFYNLPFPNSIKKWLGYIDQYIVFPLQVKKKLASCPNNTLFVFADQALGPWVPLVSHFPHVIHCHDFLAQRSALGEIKENRTLWTGRTYQLFIRNGYRQGRNFISVSKKTKEDLHRFLVSEPLLSKVIYNGLNQSFKIISTEIARKKVTEQTGINVTEGYILHVGGNQWYKNRIGVIEIYNEWRVLNQLNKPLLLIGEAPNRQLLLQVEQSSFKNDIHFLPGMSDELVRYAYSGASVFLFPSFAEGFGWPIAEAMASGCLVITTDDTPMTEVGADAAYYLASKADYIEKEKNGWAKEGAALIKKMLEFTQDEHDEFIKKGLLNIKRFDTDIALSGIEKVYLNIINKQ